MPGPDLKKAKQLASFKDVLLRYGVPLDKFRKKNQHKLRGDCPLPTHSSKESETFEVHLEGKWFSCYSKSCIEARGGKRTGNVLEFVMIMDECGIADAGRKLLEWFEGASPAPSRTSEPVPETPAEPETDRNRPLAFALKDVAYHPYLESRGVLKPTADEWGVGFFPGKGSMAGRVVFPIRNYDGDLVAYAGRSLDGSEPKYKFPPGFHKGLELYGLHHVPIIAEHVYLVEGFFGSLKLSQAGFPAVAMMGCSLSAEQEALLQKFEAVTLFLDPDDAGKKAAGEIAARLIRRQFVRVVESQEPPDELGADDIRSLLG